MTAGGRGRLRPGGGRTSSGIGGGRPREEAGRDTHQCRGYWCTVGWSGAVAYDGGIRQCTNFRLQSFVLGRGPPNRVGCTGDVASMMLVLKHARHRCIVMIRGAGCSLHPGICGCCPIIVSISTTSIIIIIGCISPNQHQQHHHNRYQHYHRLHQPHSASASS